MEKDQNINNKSQNTEMETPSSEEQNIELDKSTNQESEEIKKNYS